MTHLKALNNTALKERAHFVYISRERKLLHFYGDRKYMFAVEESICVKVESEFH